MTPHRRKAIIVELVAQGRLDKEIAPLVELSERQVKRIVDEWVASYNARNRTHAAAMWVAGVRPRKRPRFRQRDTLGLTR